jgi:hypothetical protein
VISKATPGHDPSVATTHYERLRGHVLGDGTATGGFGLVVLMRDGIAAWLAHATVPPLVITHVKAPITAAPIAPDVVHSDLICVLANMAMAISTEVHT